MNNDKYLISILITNYNKDNFLKKSINSCLNQSYAKKEIILFDDFSSDNSHNILKKYKKKNLSIIYNKRKKFYSGPLNQLYGIKEAFKLSKGKIIFLLDSDDFFLKNKINFITNKFINCKGLQFIQDIPYMSKQKKKFELKKKKSFSFNMAEFLSNKQYCCREKFFL